MVSGALVYCQTAHYLSIAEKNPHVTAIICSRDLEAHIAQSMKAIIVAENPRLLFFKLYVEFYNRKLGFPVMNFGRGEDCRIHPSAVVSEKTKIGNRVEIGANAVIEDFVEIGDGVTIGSNVVIGAEGLISLRREDGSLMLVKHAGGVRIGDDSLILAGAVIAKSLFPAFTTIGNRCQIGILANVGHGVNVEDDVIISGNTVIAGRTKLGNKVWVGASASIAQGLKVGDGAQIKMGAVVIGDVPAGQVVSGNFAVPHNANMRNFFKIKAI